MNLELSLSWLAAGILCFGGQEGIAERVANTSLRLPATLGATDDFLPATLADTGAFADLTTLTPQAGIIPFDINVALWSDGAHKTRWFAIPDVNQLIGFSRDGFWSYPTGMVWIKHFELELTNGVPESARRLETRFLVRTAGGVYGLTYRWGAEQTNAALVPAQGANEPFLIDDHGLIRTQVWRYPGRNECLACHNQASGYVLGFNTAQLNCDIDIDRARGSCIDNSLPRERGRVINQILALSDAGYFEAKVTNIHTLRALVAATNTAVSVEYRVRSYLSANCVHCHQPGAPCGFTLWNARITNTLPQTGLIDGRALMDFGDPENRIVKPGNPEKSVLFTRVANPGPYHMPMLCTSVQNTEAIELLRTWIAEDLATYQPWLATDAGRVSVRPTGDGMEICFPRVANRGYEVQWTSNLGAGSWQPLDVPGNRPFFSAVSGDAAVRDPEPRAAARFYRVRAYEP